MELKFNQGFNRILKNTGYLFSEKVFNLVFSTLVGIYVARYLGPNDYGLLQYSISFISIFIAFATLGTNQIVIRDLVRYPEKETDILGTTFLLMIISGFIFVIIAIIIGFILNTDSTTRILLIICSSTLIFQAFQVFDYWFQAKILSKYSSLVRSVSQIISSILKLIFILIGLNVVYLSLPILLVGLINGILWYFFFHRVRDGSINWNFDRQYAVRLIKDTWPLILAGLSVAVYMRIDQIMLKNMVDSVAVGNYAVAVKLSELWFFIPLTITSSVFPVLVKDRNFDNVKYYNRLQYLFDFMAGLALVIAIPITYFSNDIILLIFGSDYLLAGEVIAIHILGGVFVTLGVTRSNWIINENLQIYGMIFTLTGAILNIILNLLLIPEFGVEGAAISTIISQGFSAWILAICFGKTRNIFLMQSRSILKAILFIPFFISMKRLSFELKNNEK